MQFDGQQEEYLASEEHAVQVPVVWSDAAGSEAG